MEKPKIKIPFPIGKKNEEENYKIEEVPEEIPKIEPTTLTPQAEYQNQKIQEEIRKQEEEQERLKNASIVCNHAISLALYINNGLLMCGHCRKALYVQNQKSGVWLDLDREYPKEWLN